jgi:hypothetical protein
VEKPEQNTKRFIRQHKILFFNVEQESERKWRTTRGHTVYSNSYVQTRQTTSPVVRSQHPLPPPHDDHHQYKDNRLRTFQRYTFMMIGHSCHSRRLLRRRPSTNGRDIFGRLTGTHDNDDDDDFVYVQKANVSSSSGGRL